jgi:two-component system CheB/CheR fusion protein
MPYPQMYGRCDQVSRERTARRLGRLRQSLRQSQENLRRERAWRTAAESAGVEKERALPAICHDLRTPLNAIAAWAQVARASVTDTAQLDEALANIDSSVRLQGMLINDILDLTKSAAGTLCIERRPVDVNDVVAAALSATQLAASAKQVRIEWEPASSPAPVLGDAVKLQQVVWNLLTSAIKFTPGGGRVGVDVSCGDEEVRLRVSDTGCWIDPAFMPRLFERFQQDPPAGGHPSGVGLGLPIVRRLVEMHWGPVAAHSGGEGQGAAFTVLLPRLLTEHACTATAGTA